MKQANNLNRLAAFFFGCRIFDNVQSSVYSKNSFGSELNIANITFPLPSRKKKDMQDRNVHWVQSCPLTYRSTCPAERSRMWEDTDRGRPFLSQLSCGGGEPVATHSMLTELSRTVVSCCASSLSPSITGGTKIRKQVSEKTN